MDLPDYLASLNFEKHQAPATSLKEDLPFHMLEPRVFELFCCELVYKRIERELKGKVVKVIPIGKPGQKQYGADIYVEEYVDNHCILTLYEVKRVKEYTQAHYEKTVKRFLDNYDSWSFKPRRFNLFVADNSISAENIFIWKKRSKELSDKDISYEILTPTEINRWVRNYPELVHKYFHPAWVESLFGKNALWHLEQFGYFGFEESSSWLEYKGLEEIEYSDSFIHKNDYVKIHAYLPSLEKNSASCFFELRNGRFSHIVITLGHKQLVETYFEGVGAPLHINARPYLMKCTNDSSYICDIGNCRITISEKEANGVCAAFDALWERYEAKVIDIEELWRSSYFSTYKGMGQDVPLMRIYRGLWSILLDFASENDVFNTTGKWSIFDSSSYWIKVFTQIRTDEMEVGYHVIIKPSEVKDFNSNYEIPEYEVIICWQPPCDFIIKNGIGPRYY